MTKPSWDKAGAQMRRQLPTLHTYLSSLGFHLFFRKSRILNFISSGTLFGFNCHKHSNFLFFHANTGPVFSAMLGTCPISLSQGGVWMLRKSENSP